MQPENNHREHQSKHHHDLPDTEHPLEIRAYYHEQIRGVQPEHVSSYRQRKEDGATVHRDTEPVVINQMIPLSS